jgi:hypothetical protein
MHGDPSLAVIEAVRMAILQGAYAPGQRLSSPRDHKFSSAAITAG